MTDNNLIDREDFQGTKFPDLAVLYPEELERLCSFADYLTFEANDTVISEGQEGGYLYLVKSGHLRVNKRHDGIVYEVASITTGDIFGEASVLYQSTAGAEVRAIGPCELYVVPAITVYDIFETNENFLRATTQLAERRAAASALAVNPMFSILPLAIREVILYNAKFVDAKAGDILIQEGDQANYMFILLAGKASVSLKHPSHIGEEINIATRGSGDELGEISVITNERHGATVRAILPVRLLTINNNSILAWCARYSDFAYAFYGQVYRKLKHNRSVLNNIIGDKAAKELTVDSLPSLDEFKLVHKL